MNRPYITLGWYQPKADVWHAQSVGRDLTAFTRSMGLIPLRGPAHNLDHAATWYDPALHAAVRRRTPDHGQGEDWHQDGDTTPGAKMDQAIVLWCSNTPTLLRDKDGTVWQPEPAEIVLFRNLAVYHRRPSNAKFKRWVFRQRVEVPEFLV